MLRKQTDAEAPTGGWRRRPVATTIATAPRPRRSWVALIGRLTVGQRQHRRRGLEGAAAGAGFACVAAMRFAHAQASRPIRATVRRGTGWSAGAWLLLRQCCRTVAVRCRADCGSGGVSLHGCHAYRHACQATVLTWMSTKLTPMSRHCIRHGCQLF